MRGPEPDADALLALPLVGALIGTLAGFAGLGVARIGPHALAAATALCVLVVASGAIHLDGFLDCCDALFASVSPARRREILKDPRHGSFALAGLLCAGTTWFAALLVLPVTAYPAVLAFSGALARTAALANAFRFPDPRRTRPPLAPFASIVVVLTTAAFWLEPLASITVPAALAASLLLGRWVTSRLEGSFPGDAYGFAIVLIDVLTIAALAAGAAGGGPGGG